ncbi:efflux RND transporter periplasmic adaptor subunit [Pseudoalteromonas phenolica]|uniref:efflux RND transporter periplasmic adaptor subunit n=1 Tax=Pseudoalteromonas phenolica TaxID=161398 RepID=UPI00110AD128|nr:efflux RND transporter periplasmic adaptor subunit [Pseudoalteromonas phenolica]
MLRLSFIALLTIFTLGCNQENENTEKVDVIRPVKLFEVQDPTAHNVRSFPAEVVANQGSYLAFRVSGELIEFPVRAGQTIRKNDLLAKLDPEDFQLQYEQRKAQFELASAQLKRVESLFNRSIATKAEFDQALANKQVSESAFKIAKTNLENSELRAPFSGTVAKVFVKNFENIVAKQNILRLESRDMMDVVIYVPERLVARVKRELDYQPTVTFDGFPNKTYKLSIKEWDTQADAATLSYKVVFSLPIPNDFNLFEGMTGQVSIDLSKITEQQNNTITVPLSAVFSTDTEHLNNNSYVWVYNPSTQVLSKRKVTVGKIYQDQIDVLDGLKVGDKVVSAGVYHLSEGLMVKPWVKERGL